MESLVEDRQNLDVPTLARDHGNSRATGYRYLDEIIMVLAETVMMRGWSDSAAGCHGRPRACHWCH